MNSNYPRRSFLKKAATVAAALVVTPYLVNSIGQTETSKGKLSDGLRIDGQPSINKAFQIYCFKDGRVEIRTPRKSEVKICHSYEAGFDVDVLLLVACNKTIEGNLKEIAIRHSLSESTCKSRADKFLNELNTKGLICYGKSTSARNTGYVYV